MRLNLIYKIVVIFALLFIPFFIFANIATQKNLEQQVIRNANESMRSFVTSEANDLTQHFRKLEKLGKRSLNFVKKQLTSPLPEQIAKKFTKNYKYHNGVLRTNIEKFANKDISGVFLSRRGKLNNESKQIIVASQQNFDAYAKGVKGTVFNMYLITKQQLIRIYPKDWALRIEADHDFTKDIFYYSADPIHNPQRKPVWTAPYYDAIWKHWMTSLILPIYQDDQFMGIVGHDVILDNVYTDILNKRYYSSGYGFIFNEQRNIIIHPHHLDALLKKAQMGTRLTFSLLNKPGLANCISDMVIDSISLEKVLTKKFMTKKKNYYMHACKLNFRDWYFAIVVPEQELVLLLPKFRQNLYITTVIFAVIFFMVIILFIWLLVVSPVIKVSKAAFSIGQGDFSYHIPYYAKDEIGDMVDSIHTMSAGLKQITDDLKNSNENLESEIAQHKQTEKQLARLTAIIENTSDMVSTARPDAKITYINRAGKNLLGWRQHYYDKSIASIHPQWAYDLIDNIGIPHAIMHGTWEGETAIVNTVDGLEIPTSQVIISHKSPEGTLEYLSTIIRDISESKQTAERLRHSQKMDSLGQLAGGVAHDFNNMLTGILSSTDLLDLEIDDNENIKDCIEIIRDSAERASSLTQKLLLFSRKGYTLTNALDVHETIQHTVHLLKHSIDRKIEISIDLDARMATVIGDQGQLQNAFLNLALNARDAMPEGGRLALQTTNVTLDKKYCQTLVNEIRPGTFIEISIVDNGIGMSKSTIAKIFDPFFTTKPVGQGTGLGLAAVYGCINEHHGFILVESKLDKGSIFKIYLPISENNIKKIATLQSKPIMGSGSILLVDDEINVRRAGERILSSLGYDVFLAEDGEEAIEIYRHNKIDLVILDMIMPKLNGRETFYLLNSINPRIKVIISSGFVDNDEINELIEQNSNVLYFLKKPYRRLQMSILLNKVLQNSEA